MNILMMTNTFKPHVGGVARSVETFSQAYRQAGHRCLVVAPTFPDGPETESSVVRVPAVQHWNGSDFSVPLPIPHLLTRRLEDFAPQVIHAHHPFLLGDTALRVSAAHAVPIVFTHHTMYEQYTHYVPGNSPRMQRFVVDLAVGYSNLCDAVIAPSETVAELLRARGVTTRVEVNPTGIDPAHFRAGDGAATRAELGIPSSAVVVGHVGRLAPEKNLAFLGEAMAAFVAETKDAYAVIAGEGPSQADVAASFTHRGLDSRLRCLGHLDPPRLAGVYRAMDVFAFASQSETQGMVLVEAMAAGVPVVGVDAPGVREVLLDGRNGRLLAHEDHDAFVAALAEIVHLKGAAKEQLATEVTATAERFSMARTAQQALDLYADLIARGRQPKRVAGSVWASAARRLHEEWEILKNLAHAVGDAWLAPGGESTRQDPLLESVAAETPAPKSTATTSAATTSAPTTLEPSEQERDGH